MFPVSTAYREAIQQNIRDVKVSGSITLKDDTVIAITDEDIFQGSLYITEQCVAGEDLEVGNVYAAEMGMAITVPLEDPYLLDGARIHMVFGIDVGGSWEYVPLGYYYVTEIERKLAHVKLTALDAMLLFDVPCGKPGPSTPGGYIVYACNIAGVSLTNAAEISTFANGALSFGEPDESVKTCRDLLMWACQLLGAFARINRLGMLEIVPVKGRVAARAIEKRERYRSEISDFAVEITKVSMSVADQEYSSGTDGMTLHLEENPLVNSLTSSQINTALNNIRTQVKQAVYVPFQSDFIGDPALQPGDFVTIKHAGVLDLEGVLSQEETFFLADTMPLEIAEKDMLTTMITHSTWRYRGAHNIRGVGKSAMVRGIQQQQVKALSSIIALAKAAEGVALSAQQSAQLINDAIGGHILVRQDPDSTNEILIMDNPDPEQAVQIWRWNMGGLGYSDNVVGADNPAREYGPAITMDGAINAAFIKTGVIAAEHVQIGAATTFEEGYDPSKQHPVGMGADTNCTGLWHFDGSLNSHKGVAVEYDGDFVESKWGQGLEVVDSTVGIPTVDIINPEECTVYFLAHNLEQSPNGSVLFDLGDDANNQAIKAGIAADGRLYIEDKKAEFSAFQAEKVMIDKEGTDIDIPENNPASGTMNNTEIVSGQVRLLLENNISYGSNLAQGKPVTADSSFIELPTKAVDGNTATYWSSGAGGYPHWLRVDLGAVKTIVRARINTAKSPTFVQYELQGSNDDTHWTPICSGSRAADYTGWLEHDFVANYRYYRLYLYSGFVYAYLSELELIEGVVEDSTYVASGTWEKVYDISDAAVVGSSRISWQQTKPTGTGITVQAAISTNGGSSYGAFQTCTSGGGIPGLAKGANISNARVKIKISLSTSDDTVTPALSDLAVEVKSAYESEGGGLLTGDVLDLSRVGVVADSHISWQQSKPANTNIRVICTFSLDGGGTYSDWVDCTNGQALPGLAGKDTSNGVLGIIILLETTDIAVSPEIWDIGLQIAEEVNVSYGVNKTELDGWGAVAIQWKSSRLALVVNGEETAYIENPTMAPALAQYAYIGSSRSGVGKINTAIDELRIDQIYQPIERLFAWYLIDAPFYTTEEFAQWPGYLRQETDGIKAYDSDNNLRVLLGSWLREGIRKYGVKIIDGELYSTIVRSGAEDAINYIQFNPPNALEVFGTNSEGVGWKMLSINAVSDERVSGRAGITFHNNWTGMKVGAAMAMEEDELYMSCLYGNIIVAPNDTLRVYGNMTCTGTKPAMQDTDSYGTRYLYATEAPEILYFDRGATHLQSGEAIVHLDPIYLECVEPDTEETPWMVWVECYGENGVYVSEVGADYFRVKERNSGTSNNKIIWRHEAVRKGYAGVRLKEVVN